MTGRFSEAKPSKDDHGEVPVASRGRQYCSELSWQIAVDLEADADLDDGRGGPSHVICSIFLAKGRALPMQQT
jgi:hypothetical protein